MTAIASNHLDHSFSDIRPTCSDCSLKAWLSWACLQALPTPQSLAFPPSWQSASITPKVDITRSILVMAARQVWATGNNRYF